MSNNQWFSLLIWQIANVIFKKNQYLKILGSCCSTVLNCRWQLERYEGVEIFPQILKCWRETKWKYMVNPADTYVFETSSGRHQDFWKKTSDLRRLENVWFTSSWRLPIYDVFKTFVKRRLCSNVVVTSIERQQKWFFLILYCLKYSENFKCSSLG